MSCVLGLADLESGSLNNGFVSGGSKLVLREEDVRKIVLSSNKETITQVDYVRMKRLGYKNSDVEKYEKYLRRGGSPKSM